MPQIHSVIDLLVHSFISSSVGKPGEIISSYGGIYITEEFLESIANHLEDFMKEVIVIFGATS
jgi:hypothetical protein